MTAAGAPGLVANAEALFGDTLTFAVDGAGADTVTAITVSWLVHGDYSANGPSLKSGLVIGELLFGSANATIYWDSAQPLNAGSGNFSDASWSAVGDDAYRFTGTYYLTGASSAVGFRARLSANVYGPLTANFGNTATISIQTPSNVTYRSDSGVFLTAGVPEPISWAMMVVGFGAIGAALRKRPRNLIMA